MHNIMDPPVGTFAGSIVEPTDVPTEDILPPTEDILPPILPPTEDILPASEHSPVRFTNETPPVPAANGELSEADLAADDPLGYAVNEFAEAVERRFERLERENSLLRGQIDALLIMLGVAGGAKSADVIDLPRGFIRRRNDNAA